MFRRTFIILLIFAIAPLLVLIMAYYFYQVYVINRNFSNDLVRRLSNTNYLIVKVIEDKKRDILSWSRMSVPEVCFEYDRPEAMEVFLDKMKATYNEFSHIVTYRPDLTVFAMDSDTALNPNTLPNCDKISYDRSRISTVIAANPDTSYLIVTAPLYARMGELLGYVSAFMRWADLEDLVRNNEKTSHMKSFILFDESFFDEGLNPVNGNARLLNEPSVVKRALNNAGRSISFRKGMSEYEMACVSDKGMISYSGLIHCLHAKRSDMLASLSFLRNVAVIVAIVSLGFIAIISIYITKGIHRPFTEILSLLNTYRSSEFKLDDRVQYDSNRDIDGFKHRIIQLINHLIETKAQAQQSARLASVGRTAAMVAHDVRKPLTSMKALLKMLPEIKDDHEQLNKMMASVDRNIANTNAMLNDILEFSRDSTALELKDHDPQSIITSALSDALRNHPDSDVSIEYDLRHKDYLHVDGERIIRVLTNIIDNALDAMSNGLDKAVGVLRIGTCNVGYSSSERPEGASREAWFERSREGEGSRLRSNRTMRISIIDNGPGIPEDVLSKIFDPFFTQGKRGGTGLGLSICQKVVQMHGGKIEARSKEASKEGVRETEFIVELPATEGQLSVNEFELIHHSSELKVFHEEEAARIDYGDTANTAEFMRINKGRGRSSYLLIVDDEPLFRETIRTLLNGLSQVKDHIKVVEADSAEKALELLAGVILSEAKSSMKSGVPPLSGVQNDNNVTFDYVIADIDLGRNRMSGYEFAQVILEKYPETYVLIHSNKRKDELDKNIRHIASERFMGFLPKPMRASELLQFLACKTFEVSGKAASQIQKRKNVLVVNDEDFMRVGLKYTLGHFGDVHVIEASGVGDALTMMAKNKVDIILSDINLGEGKPDGYELLKNIRQRSAHAVKFYMISGYPKESEEHKAVSRGADGYCQLPLEDDQLRRILEL